MFESIAPRATGFVNSSPLASNTAVAMDFRLMLAERLLLLGPPVAVAAYCMARAGAMSQRSYAHAIAGSGAALVVILALWKPGFRFNLPLGNLAGIGVCYVAYCFLAACCIRIHRIYLRIPVLAVMFLPICCGYVLAVIGVLGLGFIVADVIRPPTRTEAMSPSLICGVTSWGTAIGASGHTVHLYRTWPSIPLLRRQITSNVADETTSGSVLQDATCTDAPASYNR